MFLNPGFDCTSLGVSKLECENYVCSHFHGDERTKYETQQDIESLVTDFGPFHCEKNYLINLFKALLFLGMLIGNGVANYLIGRVSLKKIVICSFGIAVGGCLTLCFSTSIVMANAGLFLIGFGLNGQIYYIVSIITEVVSPKLESKMTGSLIFYGMVGEIVISSVF